MTEAAGGGRLSGRRDQAWVLALVLLAFGLRIWAPGPVTETYDEHQWLARTDNFVDAVKTRDLDRATARYNANQATMPGVTTMLAGAAGRTSLKVTHRLGLSGPVIGPSTRAPNVLRAARGYVALACALALGALVWVASKLLGRRAALVAGALLATEPYLVGHSDLLHTDALVTMTGALALVAAAAALWTSPDGGVPDRPRWRLVALSAVAAGLAVLTKLNALPLLAPALLLLAIAEVVRRVRTRPEGSSAGRNLRPLLPAVGIWVGVAVATVFALWPALWTSPMGAYRDLVDSAGIAGDASVGPSAISEVGRRSFVVVSLAFRMTPWLLVGASASAVALAVAAARRRPLLEPVARRTLVVLAVGLVPYLVLMERSPKVYDRYLLPVWPLAALFAGALVAVVLEHPAVRRLPARAVSGAAVVAVVALAALPLVQAPYNSAWFDPLLGAERAERTIPLGWGEGTEQLGQTILEREGPDCESFRVAMRFPLKIAVPCGRVVAIDGKTSIHQVKYVIFEVLYRQRGTMPGFEDWIANAELVDEVTIGGVVYAQLWVGGSASPSPP